MQVQIQALLARGASGVEEETQREKRRGEERVEVAKPQIFDGTPAKVRRFISACKLYIRMRMREELVEGQMQWVLSYVQGGSTDVWKENIMEELKSGKIEYELVEEFLTSLKREFGEREEKSVKVAELRKLEQGEKTIEEFVQKFKRAAKGSGYEG